MKIDLRVAELLSSRLCHELISPIGAVGNGLELLEEDDSGMAGDALELSIKSARRAAALLQFYRIAYGTAGAQASVRLADARALAAGILEGGKIRLDWPAELPEESAPPGTGRLLLNMLLLATEVLPRGGQIAVDLRPGAGGVVAAMTAAGQDARLSEEMQAALAPGLSVESLTAKTVHGYFLGRLAEAYGGRLDVSAPAPETVRFQLTLPAVGR